MLVFLAAALLDAGQVQPPGQMVQAYLGCVAEGARNLSTGSDTAYAVTDAAIEGCTWLLPSATVDALDLSHEDDPAAARLALHTKAKSVGIEAAVKARAARKK